MATSNGIRKNYDTMLLCDFYKFGHAFQYPKNTEMIYDTWTPRESRVKGINSVVAFGFQGFIKEYLIDYFNEMFFKRSREDVAQEYARYVKNCLGLEPRVDHILKLHDLGYLPLEISAVPEGTKVPIRCPMLTIRNTHPSGYWLVGFLETLMSAELWQPSTTATIANKYREILDRWAEVTGVDKSSVDFQGHDFSMRGMGGLYAAAKSGAGHLLSFVGTDTVPAIAYLEKNYNANIEKEMVGCSIPASEHSVMEAHGRNEYESYKYLITEVYPKGFVSIVSDTWNLWDVVTKTLPSLKKEIMNRDGRVVVRPDCYDEETEVMTNTGWKFFKDLTEDDTVAQVNDDDSIEFVKPLKYIMSHYSGDMYHFFNHHKTLDMLVTPNHRMLFKKKGKWEESLASEFSGYYGKSMLRSAYIPDGEGLSPYDRLRIAYQADGARPSRISTNEGAICGYKTLRFSFFKQRKIDRLIDICNQAGLEYSEHKESARFGNIGQTTIYVKVPIDKELPDKTFSWVNATTRSGKWCKEFIEELSNWDATVRSSTRFKYDNTEEKASKVVRDVAVLAGYGATYTVSSDDRKEHFKDVHTVHINMNNKIDGQGIYSKVVPYEGNIYCVTVPSGRLLVKRNRCTLVCGNSGDPVKIICGDARSSDPNAQKGVIKLLWEIFGGNTNGRGYKVLDGHIGAIYGDSITLERADDICRGLEHMGFASSNIVFGIGSYTYQYVTRDTFGFALKATHGIFGGKEEKLYKDPITDNGVKKSLKGMVAVIRDGNGNLTYIDNLDMSGKKSLSGIDLLKPLFLDGKLVRETSLSEVRNIIKNK